VTKPFTTQAVAFSLAELVAGYSLASGSWVAGQQYEGLVVAQAGPIAVTTATQRVSIFGKRISRA